MLQHLSKRWRHVHSSVEAILNHAHMDVSTLSQQLPVAKGVNIYQLDEHMSLRVTHYSVVKDMKLLYDDILRIDTRKHL